MFMDFTILMNFSRIRPSIPTTDDFDKHLLNQLGGIGGFDEYKSRKQLKNEKMKKKMLKTNLHYHVTKIILKNAKNIQLRI